MQLVLRQVAAEILDQSAIMEVAPERCESGDPVEGAYILERGAVKLFRICEYGNRHLLYLLRKDGMCAPAHSLRLPEYDGYSG